MRTRFAPSPTGSLHVGGLRTALYSYIVARQTDGDFLLRIEDTDQSREVEGTVEQILRSLHWAGLAPDEGMVLKDGVRAEIGDKGPYVQSARLEIYRRHASELLEKGHAYHCFCSPERLEKMREEQVAKKQPPMYDRHCINLTKEEVERRHDAGEKSVIRMKVPREELITFTDDVRGEVTFEGRVVDDQVLVKSDGFPTYHLAHVVDDHLMDIDIVIRGEEWLSSLPKHVVLFQYFGWKPPRYAHVPLLLNRDRTKLSKRQSAVSVEEYIEKGYLPEALLNFLALLGWNPGTTQEVFSLADLIDAFSLERVQKAGAIFDLEKLDWLQGQWMRKFSLEEFAARILPLVEEAFPEAAKDSDFPKKAALIRERILFFRDAPDMLGFFYRRPTITIDLLANKKQKVTTEHLPTLLKTLKDTLDTVPEAQWTEEHLLATVQKTAAEKDLKLGQLLWPLRALLTGREYSPGTTEVAVVLGKEETMKRLEQALSSLS